ncbi:MAG: TetR/AcrR family transcriptional regulator [Roseibium album]|uniref:TetR/AcrR family transcriptional regulator n=1 Tax=Roseibium album TaxID=311410 RepID=UPI0032EE35C8
MLGRRRSFDKDKVLDTLMTVFWRQGYAGTSMSDLTDATDLTKPSLYSAFGNKEAMYSAALGCYLDIQSKTVFSVLQDDGRSLLDVLADFLKASAKGATQPNRPAGCFIVGASCDANAGLLPNEAEALVAEINAMGMDMLTQFFQARIGTGTFGMIDARALAEHVLVLQTGLVQMAGRGMDYAALERTIEIAIEGLSGQLSET